MTQTGTRRRTIGIAILVLWLGGLAMLARRELFRPHMDQLTEAGMRVTPSASFYAVLQQGRQIGFASSTIDTADGGINVRDYLVADLAAGGALHRATARTDVRLTRALRVLRFTMRVDADLSPIDVSGTITGDTLLLLVVHGATAQSADTQRVHLAGPVLLPTLVPLAVALGERPRTGASYTLPIFDPLSMAPKDLAVHVQAESLFVLQDSSTLDKSTGRWVGALPDTVRAWKLSTGTAGSAGFSGWVDEQGRVVSASEVLGLTLERRPYEVAFENWKADAVARGALSSDRDIYEVSAISAGKRLRQNLSQLRLRLTGTSLSDLDVKGYRQQLRGDTLTITREAPSALVAAYRLPDGAKAGVMAVYLGAEPLLEVDNPEIAALARRLRGTDTDPRVVAERINRWVYDSVAQKVTIGIPSALGTLHSRVGDCNEHAQLSVALARAAGIPARVAAGLAWVDGKFYYHAWPEVWLERFVAVDPTFGQFPADASHLRFTAGGLGRQAELLRLMGTLKIDVLSAR